MYNNVTNLKIIGELFYLKEDNRNDNDTFSSLDKKVCLESSFQAIVTGTSFMVLECIYVT